MLLPLHFIDSLPIQFVHVRISFEIIHLYHDVIVSARKAIAIGFMVYRLGWEDKQLSCVSGTRKVLASLLKSARAAVCTPKIPGLVSLITLRYRSKSFLNPNTSIIKGSILPVPYDHRTTPAKGKHSLRFCWLIVTTIVCLFDEVYCISNASDRFYIKTIMMCKEVDSLASTASFYIRLIWIMET